MVLVRPGTTSRQRHEPPGACRRHAWQVRCLHLQERWGRSLLAARSLASPGAGNLYRPLWQPAARAQPNVAAGVALTAGQAWNYFQAAARTSGRLQKTRMASALSPSAGTLGRSLLAARSLASPGAGNVYRPLWQPAARAPPNVAAGGARTAGPAWPDCPAAARP
jgi:hypothetical protein